MAPYAQAIRTLLTCEISDVGVFADRAREVLRRQHGLPGEVWRAIYERGVSAAIEQRDLDGVAAMVSMAISRLDSESRIPEAIAHLNFGLRLATGTPDIFVLLASQRAPFEAAAGNVDDALASTNAAREFAPLATSARALVELESCLATVDCIAMKEEARATAAAAAGRLHAAGATSQTSLLLSWYIPYVAASADLEEVAAWTMMLEQLAERTEHPWRLSDASLFRVALERPASPMRPATNALSDSTEKNWLARWRAAALDLHAALACSDAAGSEASLQTFEALESVSSPAFRDGAEGFAALVSAYRHESVALTPPRHVSLQNLGAVYASMEAVALGGSSADASAWLRWSDAIPGFVTTAVEWPVCRWRITGLLRARAGDLRGARTDLRRAIDWASACRYAFQRGLARAQLAEVMAAGQTDTDRRTEQRLHDEGWAELRSLGVDPVPHAYAASRAATTGISENARPALSRREAEVLALLARGCTYKQAAAALGISWRTVQNLTYRAYQKLGANGRVEAVNIAREHGLI